MLYLTRQYDRDNPILVGYLVSIACKNIAMDAANEALQSGSIDGKYRTALEAELSRLDNLDSCRAAMKSERAYCLDALQNDLPIGMSSFQRAQWELCVLEMFDDFEKYSSLPYSKGISKEFRQPQNRLGMVLNGPVRLMLPACQAVLEAAFRSQALVRSLRIINALQGKSLASVRNSPAWPNWDCPTKLGSIPSTASR